MKIRSGGAVPRKLSVELAELRDRAGDDPLTLREVIQLLGDRAYTLLVLLLALPFITPIPLPGLSTPFGLAIALIALRLTLGQRPWLSRNLQRRRLPAGFIRKVFTFAERFLRLLEKFLRPRLTFLTDTPLLVRLHALLLLLAALVLLLPLPIPFTNSFPAWAIVFTAAGLLERDGLFILAAYLAFAAGVVYFVCLGGAAAKLVHAVSGWMAN